MFGNDEIAVGNKATGCSDSTAAILISAALYY